MVVAMDELDVDSPPPVLDEPKLLNSELGTLGYALSDPGADDDQVDGQLLDDRNENAWYELSLHDRWRDVLKRLLNKEVRWDGAVEPYDDWDPSTTVLDPREKESLTEFDRLDKTCPTNLHRLALNLDSDGFSKLPATTQLKIVEYLLQERKKFNAQSIDSLEDPILTRAFENQNTDFVRFIIKNFYSRLPELLEDRDSSGANCLHYIFKVHIPDAVDHYLRRSQQRKATRTQKTITMELSTTLHLLNFLIRSARPQCMAASDSEGNTPMHYALAYRVCRMPVPPYQNMVLQLIRTGDRFKDRSRLFNKAQQSPYLYFDYTKREFIAHNARIRAQRLTQPAAVPAATSKRMIREDVPGKAPNLKYGNGQALKSANDELGPRYNSNDVHQKNPKDVFGGPKSDAGPRALPLALQNSKDNMKREGININPKQRDTLENTVAFGLTRRGTAGFTDGATANSNSGLRPSSPAVDTAESGSAHHSLTATGSPLGRKPMAGRVPAKAEFTLKPENEITDEQKEESSKKREEVKEDYDICMNAADNVRQQLKLHYIRSKSDIEAKELLYGRIASDKNLYFDATNLKGKTPKDLAGLVSMLANPGGFEDILSYVSLPVLGYTPDISNGSSPATRGYDANERRQRGTTGHDDTMLGRNSAVAVLDKLAESGVRRIIRLIVEEDSKSPPHTDAAIERAVRGEDSLLPESKRKYPGIAVDIWDWKKWDLSTDVIKFASPKVSEVNLYWSGNQTVLKGWANDEGIPRLFIESDKSLKSVTVHWSPGFESIQRCESLLVDFKRQVEKRTSSDTTDSKPVPGVAVHIKRLSNNKTSEASRGDRLGPTTGDLRAPPDHGWIESMELFRRALMVLHKTLPEDNKPSRVKVALIDDGVDRADLTTYQDRVEVTGMSYWNTSMGTFFQNPSWHQSTHGHGTIMANSIIRINPWVSLYAMRIQDDVDIGPRNDVSIRIHAGSAARAINDAIIRNVDIISISWTIRNMAAKDATAYHGQESEALESLKGAIDRAKERGILIFCSASDDITKKGAETLPYSQAREYIFRIGAADAYGWSDKATEDQRTIDYFLPGNQVADDFNPRTVRAEELKYRDGSSVATALAAGLASLILYLTNLMKAYYSTDPKNMSKFSRYGDLLRRRDGLKKGFENIITDDNYKDKRFLPVWDLFGSRAKEILDKSKDTGAMWDLLDELCTKLAT